MCTSVCVCVCVPVRVCALVCVRARVHVMMRANMHVCICMRICVHLCTLTTLCAWDTMVIASWICIRCLHGTAIRVRVRQRNCPTYSAHNAVKMCTLPKARMIHCLQMVYHLPVLTYDTGLMHMIAYFQMFYKWDVCYVSHTPECASRTCGLWWRVLRISSCNEPKWLHWLALHTYFQETWSENDANKPKAQKHTHTLSVSNSPRIQVLFKKSGRIRSCVSRFQQNRQAHPHKHPFALAADVKKEINACTSMNLP